MIALLLGSLILPGETAGQAGSSPALRVEVPEAAQVAGTRFALGEVVAISGEDEALVERARAVPVGYSPAPGHERKLVVGAIEDLLAGTGILRSNLHWSGSPLVSVTTKTLTLEPAGLLGSGEAFLSSFLGERKVADFRLEAKCSPSPLRIPCGRRGYEVRACWRGEPRESGQAGVDLRVLVDGELYGVVPLVFAIRSYGIAAVASRNLRPGEILNASSVAFSRVELPSDREELVLTAGMLEGKEAARAIRQGEVVRNADLRQVPMILKDQRAVLTLRGRGLRVIMGGIAKADGYLGGVVPIENPDSKKIISAKVVGFGQAELLLSEMK